MFLGCVYTAKQENIDKWLTAKGFVEKTDKYQYTKGKQSLVFYGIKVVYKYRVDDTLYTSSQTTVSGNYESTFLQDVNEIENRYQKQKDIKVLYNPKNPSESILIKKQLNEVFYLNYFAGGLIFVLLGLVITVSNITQLSKRKRISTS